MTSLARFAILKAIENVFRVCTASYKHERGWENSTVVMQTQDEEERDEEKRGNCATVKPTSLNISTRAYPVHLTSFAAREGGNLMNLVFLGSGHLIATHRGWGI